jgi:hypothetical protein
MSSEKLAQSESQSSDHPHNLTLPPILQVSKFTDLESGMLTESPTTTDTEKTRLDDEYFGYDSIYYGTNIVTSSDDSSTDVSRGNNSENEKQVGEAAMNPNLDRAAIVAALKNDLPTHDIGSANYKHEKRHSDTHLYKKKVISQRSRHSASAPPPTPPLPSYQSKTFGPTFPHIPHHSSSRTLFMPSHHSSYSSHPSHLPRYSSGTAFANPETSETLEPRRIIAKWLFFFGFLIMPCWWAGAIYVSKDPTPSDYKWKKLCIKASVWGFMAVAAIAIIWISVHPTAFGTK